MNSYKVCKRESGFQYSANLVKALRNSPADDGAVLYNAVNTTYLCTNTSLTKSLAVELNCVRIRLIAFVAENHTDRVYIHPQTLSGGCSFQPTGLLACTRHA